MRTSGRSRHMQGRLRDRWRSDGPELVLCILPRRKTTQHGGRHSGEPAPPEPPRQPDARRFAHG